MNEAKKYWIDCCFPMEDGTYGEMGFQVTAFDIIEAGKIAKETCDSLESLDITIWSITEQESEEGE